MNKLAGLVLVLASLAAATADAASRYTEFFRAIAIDNDPVVRTLLAQGLDPNLVEAVRNETGLVLAMRADADRVFKLLLASPVIVVDAQAANGDTALMLAAYKGKLWAVDALLAKKAQVNRPGWTALHYAAAAGHAAIVQVLLEHHAYIDAASPNRTTPLMMAALGGHVDSARLLLDEGADAGLRNEAGLSALDCARLNKHAAVEALLLVRQRKAAR